MILNNKQENDMFYYEDGKVVFTEKYLLKRGTCCNNNCRHCPYKKKQTEHLEDLNKKQK